MSIYGVSPLGTDLGPFGGPGLLTVLGVLVTRSNQISVVWDREPVNELTARFDSASSFENYSLDVVSPLIIASDGTEILPPGKKVASRTPMILSAAQDLDDPLQTLIDFDAPMERGVDYELSILTRIRGADKEPFAGPSTFEFAGVQTVRREIQRTVVGSQDFASFLTVSAEGEGGFRFDPNSDLALDEGDRLLTKRVFRRVLSSPGGFAHLPNYGVGFRIKGLFRPSVLQQMASLAKAQFLQEPDVVNAGVELQPVATTRGVLVRATIFIERRGQEARRVLYEFAPVNQAALAG